MADEIRNGDSKARVVRLFGHRDNAGAWQIRDFLKRSVVEFQWIELLTEEDCRRELGLSDLKTSACPSSNFPTERACSVPLCAMSPTGSALSPSPSCAGTMSQFTVLVRPACLRPCTPPRKV
jgi:hypothetical protein